ncbi:hypothetical protein JTB14_004627 [Gonioctena quinquepunctata]|nr:hypothetical protein JTB14_004627 [Gonioctena quinquepunctata]
MIRVTQAFTTLFQLQRQCKSMSHLIVDTREAEIGQDIQLLTDKITAQVSKEIKQPNKICPRWKEELSSQKKEVMIHRRAHWGARILNLSTEMKASIDAELRKG